MATVGGANHYRASSTVYARDAWQAVQRHGASTFDKLWAFLVAHAALVQGVYYVLLGLWPVLNSNSYLAVTGHKTDLWLSQMLGLVVVVIGVTLCAASYRRQRSPEVWLLAPGSAVALGGGHLFFVLKGSISAIYLVDVLLELGIVFLWFYTWYLERVVLTPTTADGAGSNQVVTTSTPDKGETTHV
jgi:hypothetical protein